MNVVLFTVPNSKTLYGQDLVNIAKCATIGFWFPGGTYFFKWQGPHFEISHAPNGGFPEEFQGIPHSEIEAISANEEFQ